MNLNQQGIDLIKSFESCRLECYKDAIGLNTIGWGHRTVLPVGSKISQQDADDLLTSDLGKTCQKVKSCLKVLLNDNQFSALVSFAYNCGVNNLKSSSLLRYVNEKNYPAAANEFEKWDHAGGEVLPGLLRRRVAERDLFLSDPS